MALNWSKSPIHLPQVVFTLEHVLGYDEWKYITRDTNNKFV